MAAVPLWGSAIVIFPSGFRPLNANSRSGVLAWRRHRVVWGRRRGRTLTFFSYIFLIFFPIFFSVWAPRVFYLPLPNEPQLLYFPYSYKHCPYVYPPEEED